MNRSAESRDLASRRWARIRRVGVIGVLAGAVLACSDETTGPNGQPYGRIGDVRIEVVSPLSDGSGELTHVVEWSSNGPWRSLERIAYGGKIGDATERSSSGDVISMARAYQAWIDLVNDTPSVSLFIDPVDTDLRPACTFPLARVTLTIADRTRRDSLSWTRCTERSLPTLSGESAGPDPQASRVVQAAALVRSFTLDQERSFRYQYNGSVAFGTVQRGGDAALLLTTPRVIENEANWRSFWADLTGTDQPPPPVNFTTDLVLVAVVGKREEAGDSVEIRGVLPVTNGTQVALWERRPGHFCTPARRTHVPYHIVVTPNTPLRRPIYFSDASLDTVPCG